MANYYGKTLFRAGLYRAILHKKNASGYAMGQFTDTVIADTTPTNTEVSNALVAGIVDNGTPGQNRIVVQRFVGQEFAGTFDIAPGEISVFQVQFTDDSPSLAFLSANALVNTTAIAGGLVGGENIRPQILNNIGMIVTIGIQEVDSTTANVVSKYQHIWYPSLTLAKTPTQFTAIQSNATNPYNSAYSATLQKSAVLQNGETLASLNLGYTSNLSVPITTPYKNYELVSVIFDGTDTSFTLPVLPLLSATATDSFNRFTLNGTLTAPSSVNTSTGVVTLSSAPAAGAVGVMWYPTADQS
jgi:hypothetical protein